jgi:hypothetical protein
MAIIKLTYQPLILTTVGEQPSLPSPADATPDDPAWDPNSNLLVGQMAYNTVDDKWYYRGSLVGIQELSTGGTISVSLDDLTDTDLTLPVSDGSILVFDTASGKWINTAEVDADTLEGNTTQDIVDLAVEASKGYNILKSINTAPSTADWYAIARWKSYDCNINAALYTHNVGGLRYDSISFDGTANSSDVLKWNLCIKSTGNVSFTKARISQYNISGDDYTYLEVYKSITNTGTFTIITEDDEFNLETDVDFSYESLPFTDVSALTAVRQSPEYDSNDLLFNRDNIVKITSDGTTINNAIQVGSNSPELTFASINVGVWDMETNHTHTVLLPAGITFDKVFIDSIMIFNDAGTESSPLSMDGYYYLDNSNNIQLVINENGYYNSSDFSGVANRGKIFIKVEK